MNAPWPIPKNWYWSNMGEVAEIVGGGTPKTDHSEYFGGDIAWITPADLSGYTEKFISQGARSITRAGLKNSGASLMPASTVLFSSRAPVGYVAIASNSLCTNQGFKSFVLRNGLLPDYVYYYLQHAKKLALELASGTTFLEISGKKAAQIPIPVAPPDEQHQIVAEIEKQFMRLEAGVAGLRRVQANLKRYRAAVLKAACEGKLVPPEAKLARQEGRLYETGAQLLERILTERRKKWNGKGKYKEPAKPDTMNLPPLPDGWMWATMDSVIVSGPQNGIYLPKEFYGRGHPILRIDDYQIGWVRTRDELNKVDADLDSIKTYQLRTGDLVINRVNSPSHLGKCLIVRESLAPALFESNMMRAVLSDAMHGPYVEFYLQSENGRSRLNSNAKWAVNQASINQQDVKWTPLPLAPPAEQQRIVAEVDRRLSVVDELEPVVSANLQRATRLRQSILQQAFSGTLI